MLYTKNPTPEPTASHFLSNPTPNSKSVQANPAGESNKKKEKKEKKETRTTENNPANERTRTKKSISSFLFLSYS
jgi:hypothetical protein